MLNKDNIVVRSLKFSNQSGSLDSLLDIEVRSGLVEDIDLSFLDHDDQESKSLQFSTR